MGVRDFDKLQLSSIETKHGGGLSPRGYQAIFKRAVRVVDFSSYKPYPAQAQFHRLCEQKRFVLACWGVRAGKTFAGARQLRRYIYLKKMVPNLFWVLVPTYKQGEQPSIELQNALEQCILRTTGRPGRPMTFYLRPPAGYPFPYVVVDVRSAENPNTLRGPKVAAVWEDEARDIPQEAHLIAKQRVADTAGCIFQTTTPSGRHNWLYEEAYLPAINGDKDYGYVHASTYDNPHLSPSAVRELEQSFPGDFARQELQGEFVSLAGLVYKDFDRSRHVVQGDFKLPTADQCRAAGEPEPKVFCGIDFGYSDPFVCLWLADWKGFFWILDEYYMPGKTSSEHAEFIKHHPLAKQVSAYYCDPNDLKARLELKAAGVQNLFPAPRDGSGHDGNFMVGIRLIVRNLIEERLKILPHCVNLIKEFGLYHFPQKKEMNTNDKPVDSHNHCLDAARYSLRSYSSYRHGYRPSVDGDVSWSPPGVGGELVRKLMPATAPSSFPAWYLDGDE